MSEECTKCGSIAGHLWFCPYSALDAHVGQRYAPDDNAPLKSGIADALSRPAPAVQVPVGWALVPVEPTPEMLAATSWPGCAATDYEHMLAAAPAATVATEAVAQGGGVDVEKVMALVLEYGHAIEQANAGFYGAMASEAISEKAAQIRALLTPAAGQGWQPIETAPKDGSRVILTDGEVVFEGFHFDGKWLRAQNENLAFATHWQPLPPPPAIANQEEGK